MIFTKKISRYIASLTFCAGVGAVALAPVALAADDPCKDVQTAVIKCDSSGGGPIFNLIKLAIQILTAGVGILAVGAVAYGGVLYASAANNAEQIKKAKGIFLNVAIGLALYAFLVVLSNFLIPGGVV